MTRKIAGVFLLVCWLFAGTVLAEEKPLMTEANFYTGNLYYCDAERNKLVLKNVNPMGEKNLKTTQTAHDVEYTEIPILGMVQMKDGAILPLADCNVYADSAVRVLITRDSEGVLRAVQMKFL